MTSQAPHVTFGTETETLLLMARDEKKETNKQKKRPQNEMSLVSLEAPEFGLKYGVYGQCIVTTQYKQAL